MGAAWLLRRLLASVAIIFAVVTFVFILIHVAPGRPCPETVERAVCEELKRQFGLDRPLPEQYWRYLVALAHGVAGGHARSGRRGRNRALPAGRDAGSRAAGLRAYGARQGPSGTPRGVAASAAQRAAVIRHAVRAGVSVPPHRRRADRNHFRLARDGSSRVRCDPLARLSGRDRDGIDRQCRRRRRQSARRHSRGAGRSAPARPGPDRCRGRDRMTLGTWLALFVALVVTAEIVRVLRHRAMRHE